jgi:hypothetical protein
MLGVLNMLAGFRLATPRDASSFVSSKLYSTKGTQKLYLKTVGRENPCSALAWQRFSMLRVAQEPHTDLLSSLLRETGVAHMKRFFTTICIYIGILVAIVHIPVTLLLSTTPSCFPIKFYFCFVVPEIQV